MEPNLNFFFFDLYCTLGKIPVLQYLVVSRKTAITAALMDLCMSRFCTINWHWQIHCSNISSNLVQCIPAGAAASFMRAELPTNLQPYL